jgi:hypothetical protein
MACLFLKPAVTSRQSVNLHHRNLDVSIRYSFVFTQKNLLVKRKRSLIASFANEVVESSTASPLSLCLIPHQRHPDQQGEDAHDRASLLKMLMKTLIEAFSCLQA